MKELLDQLTALYKGDGVPRVYTRVQEILHNYRTRIPARNGEIIEHDSLLITYGDQIQIQNKKPL